MEREWRNVMTTNLALAAVLVTAGLTIGLQRFALVHLPIVVVSGALGVWLFYVQHRAAVAVTLGAVPAGVMAEWVGRHMIDLS